MTDNRGKKFSSLTSKWKWVTNNWRERLIQRYPCYYFIFHSSPYDSFPSNFPNFPLSLFLSFTYATSFPNIIESQRGILSRRKEKRASGSLETVSRKGNDRGSRRRRVSRVSEALEVAAVIRRGNKHWVAWRGRFTGWETSAFLCAPLRRRQYRTTIKL